MDVKEYAQANLERLEGQTRGFIEYAFKSGQQSKQAEIDALQKRINGALELLRQPMQGTVADLLNELEGILDDT